MSKAFDKVHFTSIACRYGNVYSGSILPAWQGELRIYFLDRIRASGGSQAVNICQAPDAFPTFLLAGRTLSDGLAWLGHSSEMQDM